MPVIELKIPNLGESISSVTFSKWLQPDGSTVAMDAPLCEIETEKANQELSADSAGKLSWVAKEGEDLEVGAVYAKIDTEANGDASAASKPGVAVPATPLADPGEGEKAVAAPPPAVPPAATGSEVKIENTTHPATKEEVGADTYAKGSPSPAAAKILAEGKLPPAEVAGSGRDGRITKSDAQQAVENKAQNPPPAPSTPTPTASNPVAATPPPAQPQSSPFSRNERRERLSRMRRTIAKRLVSAKNNTAMLTTFNEVDMTAVMELREKYQETFLKKYGIKLGFMSIFAKACAKTLLEMPDVNARLDGDDIVYHDFTDISFAISTPNGLVVPPIRNVESLKFSDIEFQLKELATKARDGKLSLEEMTGGTFTITNGGVFGSLMSTPIINEPQSAILGMHAIKERPMAVNGEIKIRPMMYLALSYDHRVIDGSTSVTFLVKVKNLLEDPITLLLDL
ncbi:MAG: 2-oxoglutarate dehydrogenase complex dihydrolipoyllysine-residue succinyltransferase [Saprospiraceae bacterium]